MGLEKIVVGVDTGVLFITANLALFYERKRRIMPSVVICPSRNPRAAHLVGRLLGETPDFTVTLAPRCHGDTCLATANPDAVVLLTEYPARADLAHVAAAREHYPSACLIVISLYDAPHFVQSLVAAGANAFVPLEYAVERLPALIRQAAATPHTLLHYPTA